MRMGDMGEIFSGMREYSQEKRANNRDGSKKILEGAGINFESKNFGAHLIVENIIDFWPGTGKFIDRRNKFKGRGVRNLLKQLKRDVPTQH